MSLVELLVVSYVPSRNAMGEAEDIVTETLVATINLTLVNAIKNISRAIMD